MRATLRLATLAFCLATLAPDLAAAQNQPPPAQRQSGNTFSPGEIVGKATSFLARYRAGLPRSWKSLSRWGQPNGYILGQEACGAFVVGLRYGEGTLYTQAMPATGACSGRGPRRLRLGRRRRAHHDAGLQPARHRRDLSALRRHRRLGLFHRRLWHDRARRQATSWWCRSARASACGSAPISAISIHAAGDLESVLTPHIYAAQPRHAPITATRRSALG